MSKHYGSIPSFVSWHDIFIAICLFSDSRKSSLLLVLKIAVLYLKKKIQYVFEIGNIH